MIPGAQPKVLLKLNDNNELLLDEMFAEIYGKEAEYKFKLVRERDGLTKTSKQVTWLEFDENGKYKNDYNRPAIGRSLLMSPFNQFFTWQTTLVTEIVEQRDDYIKFNTENSVYELFVELKQFSYVMNVEERDKFAIDFAIWYKNYQYKGFKTDRELLKIFKEEREYDTKR